MNASRYSIPVPALWAGLGVKPPDLIRTWRDPLIRSVCWMIFHLLRHMTAAVATTALCRRWALEVRGRLRAGLWLLVAGWLLNLSFSTLKLTVVAARWTGRDRDVLSTPPEGRQA